MVNPLGGVWVTDPALHAPWVENRRLGLVKI
jgi:hypothetical protein